MVVFRSMVMFAGFAGLLSATTGCGPGSDTEARAGLKNAGVVLSPGNDEKPVNSAVLAAMSDHSKLDEAIALTGKLGSVKNVRADGLPLTDAHVKTLAAISTLIDLNISKTPITDEGVKHLASSKKLFNLALNDTEITNASLEHLGKISTLHILNIGNTKINGDLAPLGKLKNLEWIVISDLGELPDGVVDTLGSLPNFTHLQMGNTTISAAALDKLRQARPGIVID